MRGKRKLYAAIAMTDIGRLNHDDAIDGILLQLPGPGMDDPTALLSRIDPVKDVDGLPVPHSVTHI